MDDISKDQRRYRRVMLQHSAIIVVAGSIEYPATIFAMSAGNLSFYSKAMLAPNDNVVIYVQGIDRLEGTIRRRIGHIYGMSLSLSHNRRERLVEGLTIELARQHGLVHEDNKAFSRRSAKRVQSYSEKSFCLIDKNLHVPCSIVDISLTGVSVEMNHSHLKVGDQVQIGRMRCQAVRRTRKGYGFVILGSIEDPTIARDSEDKSQRFDGGKLLSPADFSRQRHTRLQQSLRVISRG